MKELAPGVHHINCMPLPNSVNAFLVDDVLIDAGARQSTGRIMRALKGHTVNAHALTHAHPDHQGASHAVCEKLGIPYWVPELDVAAAEDPSLIGVRQPNHPIAQLMHKVFTGPAHKVDPGGAGSLAIPRDRSDEPWDAKVNTSSVAVVCAIVDPT